MVKRDLNPKEKRLTNIKRVLILGHSGFIGSHIEKFFRRQSADIDIIGRSYPPFDLTKEDVAFTIQDLFDMNTAVIMLSALKKEHGDNIDNFSKNVKMVINLCKILEDHPVRCFVYFSSAAVYGEDIHNMNITEETQINPTSYYGIAKYTAERLLRKVSDQQEKMNLIILRPPVIYGPGDQPCYGPSGFIKATLSNEKITLWGDGKEKREFIFIDDVVKLVHKLVFQSSYNGVLNVASGKSYTFVDILDTISSITNSKIDVNSRGRTKDKVNHRFSNDTILKLFPEFTFTSLREGIKKTIDYFFIPRIKGQRLTLDEGVFSLW